MAIIHHQNLRRGNFATYAFDISQFFFYQTLKNKYEKSASLQELFNGEIGMSAPVAV